MSCYRCDGEGWIVTCIVDMCRGAGDCMHGDGMALCPECGGEGDLDDYEDDWSSDPDPAECERFEQMVRDSASRLLAPAGAKDEEGRTA